MIRPASTAAMLAGWFLMRSPSSLNEELMADLHIKYGTKDYKQKHPGINIDKVYQNYWSDYKDVKELNERIKQRTH